MSASKLRSEIKAISVLSILFCLFAAINFHSPLLPQLENYWLDLTLQQRAEKRVASEQIVVIDIDDASLNNLAPIAGGWPWPRAVHAELVELLQLQKPAAVVFDVLFADRDIFNPESDQYFSEVLAASNNVYLPFLHLQTYSDHLFPRLDQYPETVPIQKPDTVSTIPHASLVLPNAVNASVWRLGSINFHPDKDGVGRKYAAIHPISDWGIITMPARIAVDLNGFEIEEKSIWIDWYQGKGEPYPRLSYSEVYTQLSQGDDFKEPNYFKDKIIVIGSTAAGLHDIQVTPITSTYPGVFILATAINNFMDQSFLQPVDALLVLVIVGVSFGVLVLLLVRVGNFYYALIGIGVLIGVNVLFSYRLLIMKGMMFPVMAWLVAYIFVAVSFYAFRLLQQQREMKKTVDIFGRFLDPKVVKILLDQGITDQALAGKSTRVTILFTDIREFTHLSEYRSATEIVELLNHYFSRQVEVIFQHKGTLDKFIGDAIMAFWGEPIENPGQEIAAVNAALDMVDQMVSFRREFGLFDFDIGIGLHTGEVVVGAIGTQSRYDYTAIGDAVNVASRIEGLTKETGRRILVSEETRQACGDAFDFELIGDYKVKGREKLVTVYQPRRLSDEP
ncbi:CHASE2 domain-containing protein [Neptuniibacter sp. QD48_11]|uniref:CHASE2 domain-containing protein n=1 Tax=unclassified Neptuniibacter TaxID=2630693 RepID=UPI0039F5FD89